ncbi:zinc-binding protein A33-like [Polyodon spathula]|uniref:zinc-binding protein A33-like n=1 Tax=Polyodon spathula TaxID=7913 RepID=UPI001B7F59D0|nr:zinc-binding protein A33-like [Polyodon spathula]
MMSSSPEVELAESLTHEVTCPICLELYRDPVRLECEHNFCRSCISKYWLQGGEEGSAPDGQSQAFTCPQCREIFPQLQLRTNRLLCNIVERVRKLRVDSWGTASASPPEGSGAAERGAPAGFCAKHGERLKVYCQDEQMAICVVCAVSRDHKDHSMAPIQEALQESKERFESALTEFEEQKEKIRSVHSKQERELTDLKDSAASLERGICSQVDELLQFLEAEKRTLCSQLQADLRRLEQQREEALSTARQEVSRLQQDVTSLQGRLAREGREEDGQEVGNAPVLIKENTCLFDSVSCLCLFFLQDLKELTERLKQGVREPEVASEQLHRGLYQGPLQYTLWKRLRAVIKPAPCTMTLDPASASPHLTLSDDLTSARYSYTPQQLLTPEPANQESRFDICACVLASERFASGRHYWEVDVGGHPDWDIGVAMETAGREGWVILTPENGYWTFGHQDCSLVGIYLDYEGGQLSFYSAVDMRHLHTFIEAQFEEALYPFFYPSAESSGKPLRIMNPQV